MKKRFFIANMGLLMLIACGSKEQIETSNSVPEKATSTTRVEEKPSSQRPTIAPPVQETANIFILIDENDTIKFGGETVTLSDLDFILFERVSDQDNPIIEIIAHRNASSGLVWEVQDTANMQGVPVLLSTR